jgi:hypothetical protein
MPALPAERRERCARAAERPMDLAPERDVENARGRADRVTAQLARMAVPVESLVGLDERPRHVRVDVEHRPEPRGELTVGARELRPSTWVDRETGRRAQPQLPRRRRERAPRVSRIDGIQRAEEADVVAARDASHLGREGRTSDEPKDAPVVNRAPRGAPEPELTRQAATPGS